MKEKMLICDELEQVKTPTEYVNGFFAGLGAAGMIGGLVMGAMITFGTT